MMKIIKNNDFRIKTIKQKDLSQFVNLWNQDYRLLTSSGFLMTKEKAKLGYKQKIFYYWGIYQQNNLVGYLLLKEDKDLWIKHFLIDRNFRKRGLGSFLLKKALFLAKKKKKDLKTEVLKNNQTALNFFLKNGFQIVGFDKKQNHDILSKTER